MDKLNIVDWQRRFKDAPTIWVTMYRDPDDGIEEISHVYESREAAQCEVDWHLARSKRRPPRITQLHVHTLSLARERWTAPMPAKERTDA